MSPLPTPNEHRPAVSPVAGGPRPQWSILIPTYNSGRYLENALSSVMRQDLGSKAMEILVIDDCSTQDDPAEIVARVGRGRVRLLRQEANVGKARNYQTGLNAARGHLIHQLHGDDRVGEDFYTSMERCFESHPAAGAFFCESEYIDAGERVTGRTGRELGDSGLLADWLAKIYVRQRIQTPSIVLRREVFERLGGFDQRLTAFEDWEMWVRAATGFGFGFNAECTAQYRVHADNTSQQSILTGNRPAALKLALGIVDSYVPEEIRRRFRSARAREAAYYLTRCLPAAVEHRRPRPWLRLCLHIASYSRHPRVWYHALRATYRSL